MQKQGRKEHQQIADTRQHKRSNIHTVAAKPFGEKRISQQPDRLRGSKQDGKEGILIFAADHKDKIEHIDRVG